MPTYAPGGRIGPHYVVESVLGEGGMAVVYRCRHAVLRHVRAVKVLNEELSRVPDARARFMQEAGTQAQLEHSNIMDVVDFVDEGLLVAYAMPCAQGFEGSTSLADRLDRGPVPLATAVAWFGQLAAALGHAHARGVIHRDVKPSNVLLDTGSDGQAVLELMDFGIAKVLQGPIRTATGTRLGTLEYMAPEQIQDPRRVGPASDQYAASCVLYELLCGRRPFDRGVGETDYSFMHRVVTEVVDERPLQRVPVAVREVLRRGLAKDPGARFGGMGEMVGALRQALGRGAELVAEREQEQERARRAELERGRAEHEARERARQTADRERELAQDRTAAPASRYRLRPLVLGVLALVLAVGAVVSWLALRPGRRPVETPEPARRPAPAAAAPAPPASHPVPGLGARRLEWVHLPGGTFQMGSNEGASDEKPVHAVLVGAFEIMKTEVTVGLWRSCVAAGKCTEPKTGRYYNWGTSGREQHPVNGVSWEQSQAFTSWVGKGARLCSEAEWEYAARSGGTDRKYPWGDDDATCARAVMDDSRTTGGAGSETDGCGEDRTWPVCSKPRGNSTQGVCDLGGNVWEWVQDWYHASYSGAPTDGSAWENPAGSSRVFRGGSWGSGAVNLRAANRHRLHPGYRDYYLGLRLCR